MNEELTLKMFSITELSSNTKLYCLQIDSCKWENGYILYSDRFSENRNDYSNNWFSLWIQRYIDFLYTEKGKDFFKEGEDFSFNLKKIEKQEMKKFTKKIKKELNEKILNNKTNVSYICDEDEIPIYIDWTELYGYMERHNVTSDQIMDIYQSSYRYYYIDEYKEIRELIYRGEL